MQSGIAQLNVIPGGSASTLVSQFQAQGLIISNASINCNSGAYGQFSNGGSTNLGMTSGVALTTGSVMDLTSANTQNVIGVDHPSANDFADPNLILLETQANEDVCILNFDIVPMCNEIKLVFVFASEEYPEYVCSSYNDVFGFFISGPNPLGGSYVNQNMALIPNTTLPVAINTVNGGTVGVNGTNGGCGATGLNYSSLFVDNSNATSMQYNGFTVPITSVLNVTPCQTYHFKLAIADAGDGIYDSGVFIDFLQCTNIMSVALSSTPASCANNDGTASVIVTNGFGPYTYNWSPAPGGGQGTSTATGLIAGTTYTVSVSGAYSCITPATATVTIGGVTPFIVDAGINTTLCFGTATTLNGSPSTAGYTYNWSPAAGLSNTAIYNPVANPTTSTTYTLVVTDSNGCTNTDNVVITVDPPFSVSQTAFNVTCFGACNGSANAIVAGGTAPYTFLWTGGCAASNCTNLCAGNYTVNATDAAGCIATANTSITQPTAIIPIIANTTIASCYGVCDGTALVTASGGIGPYIYSWNSSPVQNVALASNLCSNTYIATVSDSNNCSATVSASIFQPTQVLVTLSLPTTICIGQSTTLNAIANGGNGTYTYSWNAPSAPSFSTSSSVTVSPVTTTTYSVIATDGNGCASPEVTVTIGVTLALQTEISNDTLICIGQSATIFANGTGGNGGPYSYSWLPATGLSNASIASPVVTTSSNITYTVTVTDNCTTLPAIDSVSISIVPFPVVNFTADDTLGCAPLCVNFSDLSSVSGGISSWSWTFGDNTGSTNPNPQHCYGAGGIYDVGLTVTSTIGNCSQSYANYDMISVYDQPVADFTYSPNPVSVWYPVVQFTNNSVNAVNWEWNFGDSGDSNNVSILQNPVHIYSDTGQYCVSLFVESAAGCSDSITYCLYVNPDWTFYIPNAFTPNGDGTNDFFYAKGTYISEFDMTIFDRWGNLIFHSDNINHYWDGKANNGQNIAQQDVYVYVVKVKDLKNKKHKYTGMVTLIK